MKLKWNIVHECDDEDGNPTTWVAEINNPIYGKYCWITSSISLEFIIETKDNKDYIIHTKTKSLRGAKRWVTANLK